MDNILKINLRTLEARDKFKAQAFTVIKDGFDIDIKRAAKEGSPVDTGHNRRTIDTETKSTMSGITAELFTQSGYGGYLEIGTRKMSPRPYLWPAMMEWLPKILSRIKGRL